MPDYNIHTYIPIPRDGGHHARPQARQREPGEDGFLPSEAIGGVGCDDVGGELSEHGVEVRLVHVSTQVHIMILSNCVIKCYQLTSYS